MSRRPQKILRSHTLLKELMAGRHDTVTLAAQVGVTKQAIGHLTSGKRTSCSTTTAEKISAVLGCQVAALFDDPSAEDSTTREEGEVLLTIPQFGAAIGVSRAHAYRLVPELVAKGELKLVDVARPGSKKTKTRIPLTSVQAWIAKSAAQS